MNEVYRRWAGRRGVGWVLVVGGKPKVGKPIHKEANISAVSSVGHRNCHSQPGGRMRRSSAETPQEALLVPISAHRLCSGPLWFYRVGKRPPVKADLAIYSLIRSWYVWTVGECM